MIPFQIKCGERQQEKIFEGMKQQGLREDKTAVNIYYVYAAEDEKYCQKFDKHLSALQRNNSITSWYRNKIPAGGNLYVERKAHLASSQLFLLFISPDLLTLDKSFRQEWDLALQRHEASEACIIPILLRPCDWEADSQLSCLQPLPRNRRFVTQWKNRDEAFVQIAEELRSLIEDMQQHNLVNRSDSSQPTFWNVPYSRNLLFAGREHLLQQMHAYFSKSINSLQPLALCGMAGIGKSQLALEYAHRHRSEYQGIFWIQADSSESLVQDFIQLARLLKLPNQENPNQYAIVEAVKHFLDTYQRWLLIFDNAEELQLLNTFFPLEKRGHILITTRAQAVKPLAYNIQVEAMQLEEGINFLLSRTEGPHSLNEGVSPAIYGAAAQIVQELGGLPLALDQAGAYIEETGCGIHGYLDRYRTAPIKLLKRRGTLVADDHPDSVARTLLLTLKQIEQINAKAKVILQACSFLHSDAIPEELFTHIVTDLITLDEAMEILRRYSLLQRNSPGKDLSLHRLVQTIVKEGMDQKQQQRQVKKLVQIISTFLPSAEIEFSPLCERYLLHIRTLMPLIVEWNIISYESYSLLANVSSYLYVHAQYAEALQFYHGAFTIGKQILGSIHPDIATILNNLAVIYETFREYTQALSLQEQALSIREQMFEWGHPDIAGSLNNLAGIYREMEQFAQALRYYRLALAMFERTLGLEHPNVALILDNLGGVYYELERYEDAIPFAQRALHIRKQQPGPVRLDLAKSLCNCAAIYRAQGQYEDALSLLEKALSILEEALGSEHPEIAQCLNHLALCYQAQGQKERALQLYHQTISIWRNTLGPQHPTMGTFLSNLAELYFEEGLYEEALPLFQEALLILESHLGADHPRAKTIRQICLLLQLKMRLFDMDEIIEALPPDILKMIKQGNKDAFD
ncbi:toll/interleukin-1 receptor domain-containing protein [Ktedonosporobacter rubrisoli]|uniref:Toll/interleukin-1 receptor domain-containing protein n=1 Tax=Ktedonosporobacter rubrisoli TaxID=2509675 RepID=A0A4P6JSV1_KTERU|nr:toll/interleukin-1 receptor domain-containing protein [Ktedonosporobacter rubrisoli]QBD78638.1 toll/interleukin-1 receptor domain-containing protein [Ktedonosporobacter rubrisoli]